MAEPAVIRITGASENNLRSVDVEIPRNLFTVVTGVSGSGKSSLVFDVLYREAEFRYFGSFSSHARQFLGRMKRPAVERIEGLPAAIAVQQRSGTGSQRSTVGTLTGIYDHLRLLFARAGHLPAEGSVFPVNRSLFSFNSPDGACPVCSGLGVEDHLDPDLLIADPEKTIRQGALSITTPSGYLIYSQVTMDVLDQVCRSEGFHVDIPWKDLTPEQKHIVLYGSDRIEIPYGKHPLESRMRWSGITAKPREMGYYKGILPIMETILKRDRNKNILRFVSTGTCAACGGARLNPKALSVRIQGFHIAQLSALELDELRPTLQGWSFSATEERVARPVITAIVRRIVLLERLGLGYLTADRTSSSLSPGESQRLRLVTQCLTGLSGVLYIFDEPSVGLHPHDTLSLISVLKELRDQGNTVVVVEHDEEFIRHADRIIDIGPGPGTEGGQVLLNSSVDTIPGLSADILDRSRTLSYFTGRERLRIPSVRRQGNGAIRITGVTARNLKDVSAEFLREALNVVTGVSGAGKSTLMHHVLASNLRNRLQGLGIRPGTCRDITGWNGISKVIEIDQSPIGRTPRSNPATYTGMFDAIRDLFASLPDAKDKGYGKSRFSFNTPGGRCETCEGAGYLQVGMHFMGMVEVLCETCEGQRFDADTLSVKYHGKTVSDVLELRVSEALEFFSDRPAILKYLQLLDDLGLGYLALGQRSSTLSGGEAQRVKLASELVRTASAHTLYLFDEPSTGLHQADVARLLTALDKLVDQGHTVLLIEHHPGIIAAADRILDLGPGSGRDGGHLVFSGTPEEIVRAKESLTGMSLRSYLADGAREVSSRPSAHHGNKEIRMTGVTTNNLRSVDLLIPHNKITVLAGVSGSGKSSLAFDTLYSEGQSRFLEGFSTYFRSQAGIREQAGFEQIEGLTPTFAVDQRAQASNPRSTTGTLTGLYDLFRLLFSRVGRGPSGEAPGLSSLFSFNHQHGACPVCDGLGTLAVCNPDRLITDPELPLAGGALDGTKTGKFYGDPYGQYMATLAAAGQSLGMDFTKSWTALSEAERQVALKGTGDKVYNVTWSFRRNQRTGTHHFTGPWTGLATLVEEEYARKHADWRGEQMSDVMMSVPCPECKGSRLRREALEFRVSGTDIATLTAWSFAASGLFFEELPSKLSRQLRHFAEPLVREILHRLSVLQGLGLSYLTAHRPASTLSGGELQRIRLASQLGSGLTGLTYVLDEPTLGLHPADTASLLGVIRALKDSGNTMVIVEHDREVISTADLVVDMGPGAGRNGGRIVATGTPEAIRSDPASVTGPYLDPGRALPSSRNRTLKPGFRIKGASANNLVHIDLEIPSGGLILVTGVSGSGKTSLVFDVIQNSLEAHHPVNCRGFECAIPDAEILRVIPQSFFTSGTGTPATYAGIFDRIRDLFARSEDAIRRKLSKNHFSFLGKEGRCPQCQGTGRIRISMDFLPDVWTVCETCNGTRYREEILSASYNGRNISEVLEMTVSEAGEFFQGQKFIPTQLSLLEQIGLGYLSMGQPLNTLSGGEAQRLFLASHLLKPGTGETLFLFEEPTTGLHFKDLEHLSTLFHNLADQGHTLLVIDHNPDLILQADWIIDLGPGAGENGGQLVAEGRVADVIATPASVTGRYLRTHP